MVNEKDEIINIKIRDKKFSRPTPFTFTGKDAREKAINLLKTKK